MITRNYVQKEWKKLQGGKYIYIADHKKRRVLLSVRGDMQSAQIKLNKIRLEFF